MHQRLQSLHSHIGTAGLLVAIVALVAALGGGAYAATGSSAGSKASASAKGKQGPRGKTGKTGKTGSQGPAGPQGAKGDPGAPGASGASGSNGASVKLAAAGGCAEGGTKLTVGSESQEVCNGEEGPPGPAGPTCNASGECLLPVGATETGVWRFQKLDSIGSYPLSISYPLRLSSAPNFIVVGEADSDTPGAVTGCPGTVADPEAEAGNFCLYVDAANNVEEILIPSSTPVADPTSGIFVVFGVSEPTLLVSGWGTWAVKR